MMAVSGGADSESFGRARATATVRRDSEARCITRRSDTPDCERAGFPGQR
jgi:hypothetical protein